VCHMNSSGHVGCSADACAPAVQTTLYDLIETLQEMLGSEHETQVVAVVMRMIQTGRIHTADLLPRCLDAISCRAKAGNRLD
jgi:hypothetical protein